MKLFSRLICRIKGHIPVTDGHLNVYIHNNMKPHDWEKVHCSRCGKRDLNLINGAFLFERVQRWKLSERCIKNLRIMTWLRGEVRIKDPRKMVVLEC